MWCDDECRALDIFSANSWSSAGIFIFSLMSMFILSMMSMIFKKRIKGYKNANGSTNRGLHPFILLSIYSLIMEIYTMKAMKITI